MMLSASSCDRRIKFDPDAYRANHYEQAIINEDQIVVQCYEEKFSEFACMHQDKWTELRRLIQESALDSKLKSDIIKRIDKITNKEVSIDRDRRSQ
jgi:hypothetical protein